MLRPATDDDLVPMRSWRNHPQVREVSLTQHEIGEQEHRSWWERTRDDPTRLVLVYERHGIPSGVVTFFDIDHAARSAWWGYYLDNAGLGERGELLPAWMEIQRQAVRHAFGDLGLRVLEGEVLEQNEAVRRFNRRNGFEEVSRDVREIDGREVAVWHVRAVDDSERPTT
ncbi:UDP-4-amino-4,6-dideoxy-N-acetyl-beta-L-altrosamine N-acetyltransferase [Terracoccus luteus]|jgi:UDP-4-amino-4,6-dideoxy-N-acetyl-beta-L-altrosamine N-acetyltransferase|uniref:UDP-4-amino-4, 6-dideoxy-N-acetyl-beta-L-altrosamine N-acetyltransferase n=1 Tax=Terracoccus luteus TaxID=53356 RepID=A0A495XUU3_9MICO|nr:GNAT family N-acetyltransferase [Terracoccus luteus]RKT77289.1 UDP-4-amino-4,6-dideoxy-N-acetyl-beta-L-altrosamine N-acetyltransferase [Terracoccus luteus]